MHRTITDPGEREAAGLEQAFAAGPVEVDATERSLALAAVKSALLGEAALAVLKIGRYVVLERLGAGGMGVVYAAYDPQLDRKVAIKLVRGDKREVGGHQVSQRLLREGQTLARLSHPNVVPIFDVGVFEGQVFLAMELVDGETLSAWSERTAATWRQRTAMMIEAGRGLQAAHERGIIHRDFKPSNVVLGRADRRPRVLDFGLAIQAESAAPPASAASGEAAPRGPTRVAGTPAYMAPEQLAGGPVGAAADQYGFCVALFELLHGALPFPQTRLDEQLAAKRREKIEATAPAVRLPARLQAAIRRGLAADPAARWPDMRALLAELERASRPPGQRAAGLLAAGGLLGAGVAIAAALSEAAPVCTGAAAAVAQIWDGATAERVRGAFTATRLPYAGEAAAEVEARIGAYQAEWAAAYTEACAATQLRHEQSLEVMELRMRCLADRRSDLQALVAAFVAADAVTVERAVQAVAALPEISSCSDVGALRSESTPPESRELRDAALRLRERLAAAFAELAAGRFRAGRTIAGGVVGEARALGLRPLLAEAYTLLGTLERNAGESAAAEASLAEAFWEAQATRQDRLALRAALNLSLLLGDVLARPTDAAVWSRHGAALLDRIGRPPIEESNLLATLGVTAFSAGKYAESVRHLERALALCEAAAPDDALQLSSVMLNLANSYDALGRYEEARALNERVLELRTRTLGATHPQVANVLINLGGSHLIAGDLATAEALQQRALAIRQRSFGDDGRSAYALASLGDIALHRGELPAALARFRRALQIWAAERSDASVAYMNERIAAALYLQGSLDGARVHAEAALRTWDGAEAPDPQGLALTLITLARTQQALGELDAAATSLARASAGARAAFGDEHLLSAAVDAQRASLLIARGEAGEAVPLLRTAVRRIAATHGDGSRWSIEPTIELGRALVAAGAAAEGEQTLREALVMAERHAAVVEGAEARLALAQALRGRPQARDAAQELARAAEATFRRLGMRLRARAAEVERPL